MMGGLKGDQLTVEEVVQEASAGCRAFPREFDSFPLHPPVVPNLIRALRYSRIDVQDQNLVSQGFVPPWSIRRDLELLCRGIDVLRRFDWVLYRLKGGGQRIRDRETVLFLTEGTF